jgi:hypothetical protein
LDWLGLDPSLDELQAAYPNEWHTVQQELSDVFASADPQRLRGYVQRLSDPRPLRPELARRKAGRDAHITARIRSQMAAAALKQLCLSAATGRTGGKLRFNLLNGWIIQRLLFGEGLVRKPASNTLFKLVWPLLTQRRYLMGLVQPQGIYCFYSKALIRQLARLIGARDCIEIAAGDGTLTRMLTQAGCQVVATDDFSWTQATARAHDVRRQDAREALRSHRPEVVVCSWPPAANGFEHHVFTTPSVQTYIVISSRHRFASGNWDAYDKRRNFRLTERPDLARLVLPPELQSAVYVFERTRETVTTASPRRIRTLATDQT